jgi:hypothetical protein
MIHHDRTEFEERHPYHGRVTYVTYHCGKTMIKGQEVPFEQLTTQEKVAFTAERANHCKRCLYGKRKEKGDQYMIEHGYPLVKRERRNSGGEWPHSWILVIE